MTSSVRRVLTLLFVAGLGALSLPSARAAAVDEVATANAAGRAVLLAVTDGGGPGLDEAKAAAQKAQGLVQGSAIVVLDRRDPAQAQGVARYGLAQAQVPALLLVTRTGLVVAQERVGPGAAERLAALAPQATALDSAKAANAAGRPVFLLVSDGATGLEDARAAARGAQVLVPSAVVVELDRRDPAQAAGVAHFRIAAAPAPLVLVVATNGVGVGAAKPGEGASAKLAGHVPSKAKAEYLQHLSQQRVAIVLLSRASMEERSPLFEQASAAQQSLVGKAAIVNVDLDDATEAKFVAEFKLDPASPRPFVVVINPKGQLLGSFTGAPTAEQIVQAATKKHCCDDPNCKGCGNK